MRPAKFRWPTAIRCWLPISNSTRPLPRLSRPLICHTLQVPGAYPIAPVGGYIMGIPANLPEERRRAAAEALLVFTSTPGTEALHPERQPDQSRYSVGSDPELRRLSPIFEAIDGMSWRDELQFWPRPPVPQISAIIQICGEEFHDMLRGVCTPRSGSQASAEKSRTSNARERQARLIWRNKNGSEPP